MLKYKDLEFANSIPSFSESAHKRLSQKEISPSVKNFADTIGKPTLGSPNTTGEFGNALFLSL